MAIAKMLKVRGGIIKQDYKSLMEYLGSAGFIELTTFPADGLSKVAEDNPSLTLRQVEEVLTYFQAGTSGGMFSGMMEKPAIREVEFNTIESEVKFEPIFLHFKDFKTEEDSLRKNLEKINRELVSLKPLKDLNCSPNELTDSVFLDFKIGIMNVVDYSKLLEAIEINALSSVVAEQTIYKTPEIIIFILSFYKPYSPKILPLLSENGFKDYPLEYPEEYKRLSFKEIFDLLYNDKELLNSRLLELDKERLYFKNYLPDLLKYHDYLINEVNKIDNLGKMGGTSNCLLFEGWIKLKDASIFKQGFLQYFPYAFIDFFSPSKSDSPPVILENHKLVKPYEIITKFFGLPNYWGIDPTPILALPFTIFFAINMGDAGYGIMLFLIVFIVSKKYKLNRESHNLITLAYYLSTVTMMVGILTWTWFGKSPFLDQTGKIFNLLPLINPWNSEGLMSSIILVITIGIITQYWGIIHKFIHNWTSGDRKSALLDQGVWLLLLSSILFYIATSILPGLIGFKFITTIILVISLLLTILTQGRESKSWVGKILIGLLSLYGFVGYYGLGSFLQDVLSYTRLIALNLTSSGVAIVLNNIVDMVARGVGWILVPFLWIGFHLFNLVMGLLGSFIHAFRLQAIELFGRFYEGGGTPFNPMNIKTKHYTVIKKDAFNSRR